MNSVAEPILMLQKAAIGYGRKPLMENVDLAIQPGQWVCLLGPNGSGKTTLLRALTGGLPLLSGSRVCKVGHHGYVPQRFALPADCSLTTHEFLDLQTHAHQVTQTYREKIISDLGLEKFFSQPLRTLSSGQLQRAVLAFSLWNEPAVLFLDEYLEGIDVDGHDRITGFLESMHAERGLTVVEVSHDLSSVVHTAQRVVLLKDSIVYDGSPKDHGFHDCLHSIYGKHHWIRHDH